jgi:hypothetical protein
MANGKRNGQVKAGQGEGGLGGGNRPITSGHLLEKSHGEVTLG